MDLFPIACMLLGQIVAGPQSYQATGVKVGEVTDTSAIIWVRLTQKPQRNSDGIVRRGRPAEALPERVRVEDLEGSCPGARGSVRVSYMPRNRPTQEKHTSWAKVTAAEDFSHHFAISGLEPSTVYFYTVQTMIEDSTQERRPLHGKFKTAAKPDSSERVVFTVVTGMAYRDIDHPEGFHIYDSMRALEPDFIVPTGDTVYYDSEDPRATTIDVARYHWHRMYSFPRHVQFHLEVPGYWMKDDHDTLSNDCWPTLEPDFMLPMTFKDGQRIFLEQIPMGEKTYRTFRWGKHLQIWLTEGRDFRSSNDMEDGPEKTIWGEEQKNWLFESIASSEADWKVLLSATPIVGPDRPHKSDNHANDAFRWEGDQVRKWIQENAADDLFVVCGDRHWQYHSTHPETGVQEFSCGPASDEHAGGTPSNAREECEFLRVRGGFLSVEVSPQTGGSSITFRHHDVHGDVVYEHAREKT